MMRKEDNMNTASGLRITMILLGIAVTPVLLSSSSLGNQLSSGSLISVVLLGGVILTLLSAITISVGEKARLPTTVETATPVLISAIAAGADTSVWV
ncbi:hypothetical protein QU862_30380, partial [Escherichia coli]|nr:hypothetical protein [Escherichia coli]